MNQRLKFMDGLKGGYYILDGERINTDKKPKLLLSINDKSYPAEYKLIEGHDSYGHTHVWWVKTAIGIQLTDGNISMFIPIDKLPENTKVYATYD